MELEVKSAERDVDKIHLDLERLVSEASDDAAIKAVHRFLRSRGMKAEIFDPDVFAKFKAADPDLAKQFMEQELSSKLRSSNLDVDTRERELIMREQLLDNQLKLVANRAAIFFDKRVILACLAVPLALFVGLVLADRTFSAAFLLIMCYGLLVGLFFSKPDGLESLIAKFKEPSRER